VKSTMSVPSSSIAISIKTFATPLFQRAWNQVSELAAPCGGLSELFLTEVAERLRDGDREGWYSEWARAAERLRREAGERLAAGNPPAAVEQGYLRAALLYRTAGLFLDRTPPDPRRTLADSSSAACFRMAMTLSGPEQTTYGPAGTYLLLHGSFSGIAGSGKPPLLVLTTGTSLIADGGGNRIVRYALIAETARRRGWSVLLPLTESAALACQDTEALARGANLLSDCLGMPLTVATLTQGDDLLRTLETRMLGNRGQTLRATTIREKPGDEGTDLLRVGFCEFIRGERSGERRGEL
jgi:hypothetical protein